MKHGRTQRLLAGCLLAEAVLAAPVAHAGGSKRTPPDLEAIAEATKPEVPLFKTSGRALYHFLRAMLDESAGDSALAIEHLKLASIYDAQHPYPEYMLAQELYQLEQFDDADRAVRIALRIQPDHEPSLVLQGLIAKQRGRVDEAIDAFSRASAADELAHEPYDELVKIYLSQSDIDRVLGVAQHVDGLAVKAQVLGDSKIVRDLQSTAAEATARVAEFAMTQGQIDEAETLYQHAVAEEPGKASHLVALALFYEGRSRLRDAADMLMKALAVSHTDAQLAVHAAGLYLRVGDRRAAVSCAEVLSTLATGTESDLHRSAEAMVAIGDSLIGEQALEQAQRVFALASVTQPGWSVPVFRAAEAVEGRGTLAEAAARFRKIPGGDPLFVSAQARAALCEYRRGAHAQATTMLKSLAKAFPDTPEVVVPLAMTMESGGDLVGAARLLEGLPQRKATPAVARTLFRLAGSIGHEAQALRVLQAAVARFPSDADLSFDLVKAFEAAGKEDAAITEARRLTERVPTMGVVLDFLARALIKQPSGSLDDAEEYARRAILAWPDRGRYVETLALVQEAKGSAETVYTWRRAVDMIPGQADSQLHLAEAEVKAGHPEEARTAFERAVSLAESSRDKPLIERARRGLTGLQTVARSPAP